MAITATTLLETEHGIFEVNYHRNDGSACLSLRMGDVSAAPPPLVRLHSACLFGEAFGGIDCDCRAQLQGALNTIAQKGRGVLIYLFQEGRGIGLEAKIHALELVRVEGVDTVESLQRMGYEPDLRQYDGAVQALKDLNTYTQIRLISNNPEKRGQLENGGFEVVEMVKLKYDITSLAESELRTKAKRMGHQVDFSRLKLTGDIC